MLFVLYIYTKICLCSSKTFDLSILEDWCPERYMQPDAFNVFRHYYVYVRGLGNLVRVSEIAGD